MQVRASKDKIASLRRNFGALIGASDSKDDKAHNPFVGMSSGRETMTSMSLSVYNKPSSLARPKTAQVNVF